MLAEFDLEAVAGVAHCLQWLPDEPTGAISTVHESSSGAVAVLTGAAVVVGVSCLPPSSNTYFRST
jgi:hypothetical protein